LNTTFDDDELGTRGPADDQVTTATDAAELTDGRSDEDSDDNTAVAQPPPSSWFRRVRVPVALTAVVLASAGLATWFYLAQFRPDQQTNDQAAATAIQAASKGTTALLSYSPDTLDKDISAAKTFLTGDFLNYYAQFSRDILMPAAKQKSVRTSTSIVEAAVTEMHPKSAVVLVFLNQKTTSNEKPADALTASSVKVGLTKVGDDWLIFSFDPI
jgi:Mce-associated membrane protein